MNEDTGGYYFYMFYARLSEQINMNNGWKKNYVYLPEKELKYILPSLPLFVTLIFFY